MQVSERQLICPSKSLLSLRKFSGTAPVVPFMPVFAKQLGYSSSIVGLIYFVLPIVGMLAKPIFGAIADRFRRQKFLFLLFQLLIIVSFASILLIPSIPAKTEFHCHEGENLLKACPSNLDRLSNKTLEGVITNPSVTTFNCRMKCQKNDLWSSVCKNWNVTGLCESGDHHVKIDTRVARNKVTFLDKCFYLLFHNGTIDNHDTSFFCPGNHSDAKIFKMDCDAKCDDETVMEVISGAPDGQVKSTYQFKVFFALLIVSWAGMAVVVSVGDAICFEMLGDKPQRYGHQRLWGSVGWGSFSIISGLLIDKFSEGKATKNYAVGFYIMAILIFIDMAVSSKLKYSQTKLSTNIMKDVWQIVSSFRVIVFFMWCIVVGLGTAMVWNFLFWHLEDLAGDNYGGSMKTLQGLVMGIQCFGGELPFFFISGKLLKKIGHVHAMSLVLLGFGVRFFLYSVLSNPWYVLPIELMNGVTFGVLYATMASYASIIAPSGTEATMQVNCARFSPFWLKFLTF